MAWTVNQANIGATHTTGAGTTAATTTTATVASAAWIFVFAGGWSSTGTGGDLASVSGGGLTWELLGSSKFSSNGDLTAGLARAYAASGLASGATITATFTASESFKTVGGASFLGGGVSSALENTASTNGGNTTGWTTGTGPNSATASALIVGGGHIGNPDGNTPDGVSTEAWEVIGGGVVGSAMLYRFASATGNNPVGGTWTIGGADTWAAIGASLSLGGAAPDVTSYTYARMR